MNPKVGRGVARPLPIVAIPKGAVVWAPITPDRGLVKRRRSVVLKDWRSDSQKKILVVGVTTDSGRYDSADHSHYPPDLFIPMPYSFDGTCASTFERPCAAKADWIQLFEYGQIEETNGRLSPDQIHALIETVRKRALKGK